MVRITSMMVFAIFGISLLALSGRAQAGSTCTCKYFGQKLQVGTKICMKSWKGLRVATCGFELNNTSWKISDQKCQQSVQLGIKTPQISVADLNLILKNKISLKSN
tara:strand:- start:667 stop:984 length:318 start_codon:yes stop_codon:yes gene_type:complete